MSVARGYDQGWRGGPAHEPGNYRNHHRYLGDHHLGDRDSSAHLSAEPRAGEARKWLPARARPSQARTHPERRPLALCFPALGVLCGQIPVRGRQVLTT